MDRLTSKEVS